MPLTPSVNANRTTQETAEALREQALKAATTPQQPPAQVKVSAPTPAATGNRVEQFIKGCTPEQLERLKTMTEDDFMEDALMQAIPFELPDILNVKLKDPLYLPRLVNWKGHGGANFGKMRALGFEPCTSEDVLPGSINTNVFKPGTVGNYEYYDVVLMKIHKLRYFAALKANLIASRAITNQRTNIMEAAVREAQNTLQKEVGSAGLNNLAGKVSTFVPSEADAASLNQ